MTPNKVSFSALALHCKTFYNCNKQCDHNKISPKCLEKVAKMPKHLPQSLIWKPKTSNQTTFETLEYLIYNKPFFETACVFQNLLKKKVA